MKLPMQRIRRVSGAAEQNITSNQNLGPYVVQTGRGGAPVSTSLAGHPSTKLRFARRSLDLPACGCVLGCSLPGLYAPLARPASWTLLPPSVLSLLLFAASQSLIFSGPAHCRAILVRASVCMKIQCDSCGIAAATVVCCADEAALCARCDVEIHAANRLASKHQRLPLDALDAKLPRCDVCQEKAAFIFCVEDRALFCRDCDEPIHVPGTLSGNHQRYLATGIRVGFGPVSTCGGADNTTSHDADHHAPPKVTCERHPPAQPAAAAQQVASPPQFLPQGWAVDEFLQFSDYESSDKLHKDSPLGFKELEWFAADMELFQYQAPKAGRTAAEVPELFASQAANDADYYYRPSNKGTAGGGGVRQSKKARVEIPDDEDFFIVPDLG